MATQIPSGWPPTQRPTTPSLFEPHRPFIEAQLRLKRNAMARYQDLLALYAAPAEVIWLGPYRADYTTVLRTAV